jgi:CRP-like cAMP-binding protein
MSAFERVYLPVAIPPRSQCITAPRPCLHFHCRYNIFEDSVGEYISESCALDLASAQGEMTPDEVANALGLTRQGVEKILERALHKLRERGIELV